MGEHISPHREEQRFGISRANGSGLNSNSKRMVVFPNGSSPPPSLGSKDVSMVCSTISDAHLGKLANRIGRGLGVNGNCSKKDSAPEFDGMCCDGQPNPSEASPILFTSDRVYLTGQKLSGAEGNPQACSDVILRPTEDEGSIDASMEIEGDRG